MPIPKRSLRQVPAVLALLLVLAFVPGCPLSPDSDDGGGGTDETRLPERTTVDNAIEYYRVVWEQRLIEEYRLLLNDAFEFYPRNDDITDLGEWYSADGSWSKVDEMEIAANMFNPDFDPPGGSTARRVERIEMTLDKRSERTEGDRVIARYNVDAFVWFNSTDALHTVAVFEFELLKGDDDLWQIIAQREEDLL